MAVVVDGLDHAWDVVQAPDGTLLVDERSGGFTAVLPDGTVRAVDADFGDLFARGETGLMGLALDPAFEENRRLYSCQGDVDGSHRRHRLDGRRRTGRRPPGSPTRWSGGCR